MWLARWGGFSSNGGFVTDRIALILAACVIAAITLDVMANGGMASMFAARKFADMLEYLSFWR